MSTSARYNPSSMVWEHKHPGKDGYHWASATHPKDPEAHVREDAANPEFPKGTTKAQMQHYDDALNRRMVMHIKDTHPHLARFQKTAAEEEADFALEEA